MPKEEERNDKVVETNKAKKPLLGIMIALCCHHRCDWGSFVGKKYLLEKAGFSPQEFKLLCGITSWATCGSGKPRNSGKYQNRAK
jgi:tRNA:m4X modification enzyme